MLLPIPASKIVRYITQHPASYDEFFLPMTTQAGLNPASGIKIFPSILGKPDQLDALKKREAPCWQLLKELLQILA